MYCRKCGYQLVGLSENRCPECGRPFDPTKARTFLRDPRSWALRRRIRRIAIAGAFLVLLVLVVAYGSPGYVYWRYHADWQAEQRALAILKSAGANSSTGSFLHLEGPKAITRLRSPVPDWLATSVNHLRDRLQYINADGKRLSAGDFAYLSAFKQMREIGLTQTGMTDDDLRHLEGLTHLTYLRLGGNPRITDAGLAHLTGLSGLKMLLLGATGISGQGLKQLQALAGLDSLDLSVTRITDEDLAELKAFPSLGNLHLMRTAVTDAGLVHLKALPLSFLNLTDTKITDAGLVHLKGSDVEYLMLGRTKITDAGLAQVGQITPLVDVDLRDTSVTDAGLPQLGGLKNLRRLWLRGTVVTAEGVDQLRKALPGIDVQR